MTYVIFGKNRKFEDFLIFVETLSMKASALIKMLITRYKSDIYQFLVTQLL